ncbi:ribosome maturation factor RimP [Streptomyces sp. RFCAC02]|uniref:ribosome maturation factor RimP n=1 Tax=Streptomyces sp. RFCAC02 TaxID=2499143 RepID=UPI001020D9BC|nr:ribosome maturation factor RimP [Streptomyces sp. RFCAC02]
MSTTQIERLRALLEPLAAARGMDLEDVRITPAGRRRLLQVVVDTDEGVRLDACADLSRDASAALDASDVMGDAPYELEVTSPGAERSLSEPRHWRRATGRLVLVTPHRGTPLTARVTAADEAGVDLEVPGEKGRRPTARRVEFTEIAKARVQVEFNRKPAAADDESQKEA